MTLPTESRVVEKNMQESTTQINAQVKQLMELYQEFNFSMHEMALGIESINNSINSVNELTIQNVDNIGQLNETVSKFKV